MEPSTPVRLIICDDHRIVIEGLQRLLADMPRVECTGTATGGEEVLALLGEVQADIVILDLNMPGMDGAETMRRIKKGWPGLKIIILTMDDSPAVARLLIQQGADGYLLKTCGRQEFLEAVREVHAGNTYFLPGASDALRQQDAGTAPPTGRLDKLSTRELMVLRALAEGLSNKEIGERLFISHRTVDTHRTNLMKKLRVHNLAGLVRIAIAEGLVR